MSSMLKKFGFEKVNKTKTKADDGSAGMENKLQQLALNTGGENGVTAVGEAGGERREGKLVMRVVEGTNLPAKGPSDTPCKHIVMVGVEHNQQPTGLAQLGSSPTAPVWNFHMNFDCTNASKAWNGLVELTVHDYTRRHSGDDVVGRALIRPPYGDEKVHEVYVRLWNADFTASLDSEIKIQMQFKPSDYAAHPLCAEDFELLQVVGKGSFGKVMQVRKKDTGRIYAMKILKKSHLIERDEVGHTRSERHILEKNTNPFLVGLKFSFQTPEKLYLVLDYVNGGELFYHLQSESKFSLDRSKFYAAQLLTAIDDLHSMDVIYRDLKPENILIDFDGYIALTDFGLCKENVKFNETTNTFCGTPEYMAPEVLQQKGYGPAVDWWTLGILLYEMLTGLPPFYDENTNQMYHKILFGELEFTEEVPADGQALITGLLQRDPIQRLGYGETGAQDIKTHPFFADINFEQLLQKKLKAPWRPQLENHLDVSNFDPEFTQMPVQDSVVADSHLSRTVQDQFTGFTYVDDNEYLSANGPKVA